MRGFEGRVTPHRTSPRSGGEEFERHECSRFYRPASLSAGPADHRHGSAIGRRPGSAPLTANVNRNGTDRGRTTARRSSALPYRSVTNAMARPPDNSRLAPSALGCQEPATKRSPSRLILTATAQGSGTQPVGVHVDGRHALQAKDAKASLPAAAPFLGNAEQHGRRTAGAGDVVAHIDGDPCRAAGIQGRQAVRIFRFGRTCGRRANPQGERHGKEESPLIVLHYST